MDYHRRALNSAHVDDPTASDARTATMGREQHLMNQRQLFACGALSSQHPLVCILGLQAQSGYSGGLRRFPREDVAVAVTGCFFVRESY